MWIVRNTLRGTLTFRGLGLSIAPGGEVDIDALGRERAEASNQIQVAFEEGYLQTVSKDSPTGRQHSGPSVAEIESALDDRLASFKASLKDELQELRTQLSGDVGGLLENLKVAKLKLNEEKRRVLVDSSLSAAEVRARLAFLEEQERDLTKNFTSIGRKADIASDGVEARADLLSSM